MSCLPEGPALVVEASEACLGPRLCGTAYPALPRRERAYSTHSARTARGSLADSYVPGGPGARNSIAGVVGLASMHGHVLLTLTAVVATAISAASFVISAGAVISEIVAEMPSVVALGRVWPDAADFLLPSSVARISSVIARSASSLHIPHRPRIEPERARRPCEVDADVAIAALPCRSQSAVH